MKLHWTKSAVGAAGVLVLLATLLAAPVPAQAESPPLVPGESVGSDPDEESWEGITIPTEGVLPDAEVHPSLYTDAAGVDTLRARIGGAAPDPHGHYAMAWSRLIADADAAVAAGTVDPSDDVKTKAAKATAFAWLITREERYLDAAVANLAAAYDTIVPTDQYVALQMTNYALAYDWVAADLSAEQDAAIRAAVKRGADWLDDYLANNPGVRSHNHRSKAGAALGSWALAFSADPNAPAYLDRGLANLNRVFRYMFTKDGIHRDGAGYYWIFTIINSTPFLWQYRNVSGVDLFPALQPAFEWQLQTVNPRGLTPPLDDAWYKVTWLNTVASAYAETPTGLSDTGTLGELFQWQFFASDLNAARYPDDWTGARDQFYGWPEEIALYDSTIAEVAPDDHRGTIDLNAGPRGGDTIFRSDWRMGEPGTRWGYFTGVAMSNNHDHADGLQLLVDGEDAILARDNGYGPLRFGGRDEWKGPEHHNVVTADGAAVGDPQPTRGFLSGGFGFAEKSAAYWNDQAASHTRAVAFPGSDYFVVLDRMAAETAKTWDGYWHVRGELSGVANRRSWTTSPGPWGGAAQLHALTLPASAGTSLVTDQFNPYGTGEDTGFEGYPDPSTDVEQTTGLRVTQHGTSAQQLSVLVPSAVDGTGPRLEDLGDAGVLAARVSHDGYVDTVVAPRSGESAAAGGLAVEAGLGWVRTTGGGLAGWAVHDGVSAAWQGTQLGSASAPVTLAAEVADPARQVVEVAALEGEVELTLAASPGRPLLEVTLDGAPVPAQLRDGMVVVTLAAGGELVLSYGAPAAAPARPTGLTATGYAGAVALSWEPTDTATGYRVLRRGKQIAQVSVPSYEDGDVVDGRTYPYRVVAVNEVGRSSPSEAVRATAGAQLPAAPEGLIAGASNRLVELSWLPVRDAATYEVLRAVGDDNLQPVATGVTETGWADTSVTNGLAYRYAVRATNQVGTGDLSAEVLATPLNTPPDTPQGLSAERDAGSVTLAWTEAARADSYRILRGGLTDESLAVVADGVTDLTWTDTGVVDGTGYTYRVVAANDAGDSEPSRAVTAVPGCSLVHPVGPDGAVVEAERYSGRSGEYQLVDRLDRFGGRVATVPRGSEFKNNPDLWGRYDLEVAEAGRYFVVVLGFGESGSNDSVFVSMDDSTPATVNLSVGDWFYRQSAIGFDLEPGFHTLLVKSREDGALVDRFVVYPSASIPDEVRFSPVWTLPDTPECGDGAAAPAAPEAVTSVAAERDGDQLTLRWSGSRLAASYTVSRDGSVVATGVTSTDWTDPSPGPVGADYVIVATNPVGDSPPSDPVSG
ncbi:MAG: hypothetical protein GEV12_00740 [Micromonosporaceae bacterium]|nr:hypothetical protein [Micromonosporaceae bacterium]